MHVMYVDVLAFLWLTHDIIGGSGLGLWISKRIVQMHKVNEI
jgi:hypothetical protein